LYCSKCGYKFEKFDDKICRLCGSTSKSRNVSSSRYQKPKKSRKKFTLLFIPILVIGVIFGISNFNLLDQEFINTPNELTSIETIQTKIQQTTDGIVKKIEEEQTKIEEDRRIADQKHIDNITKKVHVLINNERVSHGLTPLSWNSKIAQAALNHSNDMASRNYFEHNSPEGYDFSWRYAQVGFSCSVTYGNMIYGGGENIMFLEGYYGVDTIAAETVNGWMNSPGHRANILTPHFQSQGIGTNDSGNQVYVTQNFC
jgi:uncharacterized protein YkwD